MGQYWTFYKPVSNPTGVSGTVGGVISTTELLPRKDTLFSPRETSALIDVNQYRKVFAKQVYSGTFTGVTVQLVNVEYTGQVSFGISTDSSDSISSATVAPSGIDFSGNVTTPITLTGTTTLGSLIPIWVKQTISANSEDDSFVVFQLQVLGTLV